MYWQSVDDIVLILFFFVMGEEHEIVLFEELKSEKSFEPKFYITFAVKKFYGNYFWQKC